MKRLTLRYGWSRALGRRKTQLRSVCDSALVYLESIRLVLWCSQLCAVCGSARAVRTCGPYCTRLPQGCDYYCNDPSYGDRLSSLGCEVGRPRWSRGACAPLSGLGRLALLDSL